MLRLLHKAIEDAAPGDEIVDFPLGSAALEAINEIVSGGGSASAEPVSTTVKGFGGDVTVTARLNADNTVSALSIDTPDETDGLGKLCSESAFTDQFVGKAAPFAYGEDGIEAVTGTTVTSTAVLDALNAIVPAGDKTAVAAEEQTEVESEEAEEIEAEAPEAEETGTEEADTEAETAENEVEAGASHLREGSLDDRDACVVVGDVQVTILVGSEHEVLATPHLLHG